MRLKISSFESIRLMIVSMNLRWKTRAKFSLVRRVRRHHFPRGIVHRNSPTTGSITDALTDTFLNTAAEGSVRSSMCPASSSERGAHRLA